MDPQLLAQLMGGAGGGADMFSNFGYGLGSGGGGDEYGALGSSLGMALGGPIGGAIGGLAGGYFGGRKAKRQQKKLKKKINQTRAITRSIFGKGLNQQEALARQATQQELGGFDTAKRGAQMAASGAKRSALEREQQQLASGSQALANRGLGGTSRAANLQRAIGADTTRAMSGIDEGLANYFGQLAMGKAGVESRGTRSLADLAGQRSNFDIEDAQFWMPQQMHRLGGLDTKIYGGGNNSSGGFDLSSIFG